MSAVATGLARCASPERYVKQLVSHWGHKMATAFADGTGTFPFSDTEQAEMTVGENGIAIKLTTADHTRNLHLRGVIERHIDRFAFREAPLSYEWIDT